MLIVQYLLATLVTKSSVAVIEWLLSGGPPNVWFFKVVEFAKGVSVTNGATKSSLIYLYMLTVGLHDSFKSH